MRDKPADIREFLTKESIAAYREYVIEECARVAESSVLGFRYPDVCEGIAAAIRALKDKPNERG